MAAARATAAAIVAGANEAAASPKGGEPNALLGPAVGLRRELEERATAAERTRQALESEVEAEAVAWESALRAALRATLAELTKHSPSASPAVSRMQVRVSHTPRHTALHFSAAAFRQADGALWRRSRRPSN